LNAAILNGELFTVVQGPNPSPSVFNAHLDSEETLFIVERTFRTETVRLTESLGLIANESIVVTSSKQEEELVKSAVDVDGANVVDVESELLSGFVLVCKVITATPTKTMATTVRATKTLLFLKKWLLASA
jgi:hypothetical protein